MSKFNSNEYVPAPAAARVSKVLSLGEQYCRIVNLGLEPVPWNKEAYQLTFTLEGKAIGDEFEGIDVDKTKPELGKYEGQIAWVNAGRFPFSTFTSKAGITYDRDDMIFSWINECLTQLGVMEDVKKANVSGNDIFDYINNIKPFLINPNLWGTFTIAGREYWKAGQSRPNYNMFFPRKDYNRFAFTSSDDESLDRLIRFNESLHIVKTTPPGPVENNINDFNKDNTNNEISEKATNVDDLPF